MPKPNIQLKILNPFFFKSRIPKDKINPKFKFYLSNMRYLIFKKLIVGLSLIFGIKHSKDLNAGLSLKLCMFSI